MTIALAAHDVFKIYEGKDQRTDVVALRGVNVELHAGEFVSIIGPSGSGKTTLISVLGGLIRPTAGTIFIRGTTITSLQTNQLVQFRREHIGFVFQISNLVPMLTLQENVMLPMKVAGKKGLKKRTQELLSAVGLKERRKHKPAQLSGGELQRAAIACALANDPEILLGDEITGELDTTTSQEVMDYLKDLNKERGLAMLVVTHNEQIANQADRILRIKDGSVLTQRLRDETSTEELYEISVKGRITIPEELRRQVGLERLVEFRTSSKGDHLKLYPSSVKSPPIVTKEPIKASEKICPVCSRTVPQQIIYCIHCGNKIN
ncbi:MAG: ATP-binding cassette domain-containing protein [Candidatus Heimdallarchaeota archaeon]|nr:MAG: ATP-binding cassette domain-containing protein [Candidatus Heimdallarchaeota archaeon]